VIFHSYVSLPEGTIWNLTMEKTGFNHQKLVLEQLEHQKRT
jgi:hypothetical protein